MPGGGLSWGRAGCRQGRAHWLGQDPRRTAGVGAREPRSCAPSPPAPRDPDQAPTDSGPTARRGAGASGFARPASRPPSPRPPPARPPLPPPCGHPGHSSGRLHGAAEPAAAAALGPAADQSQAWARPRHRPPANGGCAAPLPGPDPAQQDSVRALGPRRCSPDFVAGGRAGGGAWWGGASRGRGRGEGRGLGLSPGFRNAPRNLVFRARVGVHLGEITPSDKVSKLQM